MRQIIARWREGEGPSRKARGEPRVQLLTYLDPLTLEAIDRVHWAGVSRNEWTVEALECYLEASRRPWGG